MKKKLLLVIVIILIIAIPSELAELYVREKSKNRTNRNQDITIKIPEDSSQPQEVVPDNPVLEEKPKQPADEWWAYPKIIKNTSRNGDDLLVLVNKEYRLPSSYSPKDLVLASNSGIRRGESYYLRSIVINDLKDMVSAAKSDNVDLSIVSGYRSYVTQQSTYNYWLSINNHDMDKVDTFSARPGHSQHQLGTAIDFSTSEIDDALGDSFTKTKASKWLTEHSYKYGFVISYPQGHESTTGYQQESWHYRYIGKENASLIISKGQILETFLRLYNP